MNMKETFWHCQYWFMVVLNQHVLIFVSSKLEMDPKTVFLLYNSLYFVHGFAHLSYHSYCIQLSYREISQETPKNEAVPFFASGQPLLEPRRPTQHYTSTTPVFINNSIIRKKSTRQSLLEFKRKAKSALPSIAEIDRSLVY